MARPKNEIPTELLAARVPASLVKRLHEEADRVGVRLGKYLTRALEEAVEEGSTTPTVNSQGTAWKDLCCSVSSCRGT
jgi:hypothetical protein